MAVRTGSQGLRHESRTKAISLQKRRRTPDVFDFEEIERPAVGEDDVLICVHAAGINHPDGVFVSGTPILSA